MNEIKVPVFFKTFKRFKLKPLETIVFCELWQNMITLSRDKIPFFYHFKKAAQDFNIDKNTFLKTVKKFQELNILQITKGRNNRNLYELNLIELQNHDVLASILKSEAIEEFSKYFSELSKKHPPVIHNRENYQKYYDEIQNNRGEPYIESYESFCKYMSGVNPMNKPLQKAFTPEPITYKDFAYYCEKLTAAGISPQDVYRPLFDKEINYLRSQSMDVLFGKWVDQALRRPPNHSEIDNRFKKMQVEKWENREKEKRSIKDWGFERDSSSKIAEADAIIERAFSKKNKIGLTEALKNY